MKVVDGIYAGGIESCTDLVLQGKADPSEFRLLAGYAGWGPMQLEYEIQERAWWVVAASPALVKQVIDGKQPRFLFFTSTCTILAVHVCAFNFLL
jgi:putative AlgH/UPF0301 family transcriptional regulator